MKIACTKISSKSFRQQKKINLKLLSEIRCVAEGYPALLSDSMRLELALFYHLKKLNNGPQCDGQPVCRGSLVGRQIFF